MFKGLKRANKIIDDSKKEYETESVSTQLRIIRTHIGAQAGELSNLLTHLSMIRALLSGLCEDLALTNEQLQRMRPVCEHAPDGGNHPGVPQ